MNGRGGGGWVDVVVVTGWFSEWVSWKMFPFVKMILALEFSEKLVKVA